MSRIKMTNEEMFKIKNMPQEAIDKMNYKARQIYYKALKQITVIHYKSNGVDNTPYRKEKVNGKITG